MKAVRQDVKQEAANELVRIERHDAIAGLALAPVIFPFEADAGAIEGDDAGIGDGDAVGIAGEIGEHGIGTGEGTLGIDNPLHAAQGLEELPERIPVLERSIGTEELQRAFGVGGGKPFAHEPPEQSREHLYGEEEFGFAGYPTQPVGRETSARDDAVHVRMMRQRRTPSVQHHGNADLCTQMFGIGGNREQGLRRRLEQGIIDHGLVRMAMSAICAGSVKTT